MIHGKDISTRTEKIRQFLGGQVTPLSKHNLKISETETDDLDVFQVPIDFLLYRISNTRTEFDQFVVIQNEGLNENYFKKDPESENVQALQHKLLQKAYNEKKLFEKFENGEKQGAPLIISIDGFVIAGNRRLAVYRDLYEKSYGTYSHFKNIKIVIWPFSVDSEEVHDFESLQEVEEDVKSPFSWISVAMRWEKIINDHPEEGYDKIINRYKNSRFINYKRENEQKEEINIWVWAAQQAMRAFKSGNLLEGEISGQEQVFKDWSKERTKLVKTNVKPTSLDIYDHLNETIILSDPTIIGDRKYNIRRKIGKYLKKLIDKKTDDLDLRKPEATDVQIETAILDQIKNTGDKKLLTELTETVEKFDNEEKYKKDSQALMKSLKDINSKLQTAVVSALNENTSWIGTKEQIDNIEKLFNQLKQWVYSKDKSNLS
tara:strand:+ start:816 stop:2111 length:1296 start_codon:yes stop_codon:yes gene_type:complete